jgi:hypothetical protein
VSETSIEARVTSSHRSAWRSGLSAVACALLAATAAFPVEAPRRGEYEVKAAFLYNFAKFVKWPDGTPTGPTFVIAVLGDDPFGAVLDRAFADKTILGKPVELRRVASPEAAREAQMVFVASSEEPRLAKVLAALGGSTALTVGETDGFADRGGMIAFQLRGDVVRFDINLDQVEREHLRMSSQLIRLAQRLIGRPGGSG